MAESVKQPLSFNRLRNVIVATESPISVPTAIDYSGFAADSWLILPMENEVGKLTEKAAIRREQSQACLDSAECEQARPKVKEWRT